MDGSVGSAQSSAGDRRLTDTWGSLAEQFQRRAESRRGLLRLPDEEFASVLQQFLIDHSAGGQAIRVVPASDVARVRGALLLNTELSAVLRELIGASSVGGESGALWWSCMVDEFLGLLHVRQTALQGPRRLCD